MPSAKLLSKPTPPKDKVKRKRIEEDADVTATQKTPAEKPSKKSRTDNASSVANKEPQPLTKKIKQDKAKKLTEAAVSSPKEVESPKKEKVKGVTFTETVSTDGRGTRKVNIPHRNPKHVAAAEEGGVGSASFAAPEGEKEEEELHLQGFSSESDSSDEDMDVGDAPPLDISKLPAFSKDDAVVQRKLEKAKKYPTEDQGVLYIGRIPHGFYENQMRTYFSQFGDVTRLRLSRNKKTGRSKHYAFIEFSSSAVADIVSETMDNYLLLGHIIKCKVIPKDQVHPELWVGANKKWRMVPRDRVARVKQNKPRTEEEQRRAESKLLARQKKKQSKILALGIDYDFQEVAYKRNSKDSVGVVSPT